MSDLIALNEITFCGVIRDITALGLGVVDHPDGRVFFVEGAWPGDEATFEIISVQKRYGHARLLKLSKKSSLRRSDVPCKYQSECGGCLWMPLKYEAQLELKAKMVAHTLKRMGIHEEGILSNPIASPLEFGYRNRAQVKTDGRKLGFIKRGSKELIDIDQCLVLNVGAGKALNRLRSQLPNPLWNSKSNFLWNYIDFNDQSSDEQINKKGDFQQANDLQNEAMRAWVSQHMKFWEKDKDQNLLELYAGSGNFTELLAALYKVTAVELFVKVEHLKGVKALKENVDSKAGLKRITSEAPPSTVTVLFLNPPRTGWKLASHYLEQYDHLKRVIYVSCNLVSWSQDALKLMAAGFRLIEVQPIDQFPQTPHIEICSIFEK